MICKICGCELDIYEEEDGICNECRWENMSDEDIADRKADEAYDLERERNM